MSICYIQNFFQILLKHALDFFSGFPCIFVKVASYAPCMSLSLGYLQKLIQKPFKIFHKSLFFVRGSSLAP